MAERCNEPLIIVGIGMPGSGKTTILKPLAEKYQFAYINRDEIRKEFFGDPLDWQNQDRVWNEANERAQAALLSNTSTVYDANFAEQKKRRDFVQLLRTMGWKRIIGLYVNTPVDLAKERNRNREHIVSDDEIEKCYVIPLTQNPPSLEDGFDELYSLEDIEVLESKLIK